MEKIWLSLLKYFGGLTPEKALRLFMAVIIIAVVGWAIGLSNKNNDGKVEFLKEKNDVIQKSEYDIQRLRRERDSLLNISVKEKQETIDYLRITLIRSKKIKDELDKR